jgi:hypothetical protein
MIRATTACFRFKLPYVVEQIRAVTITFWQTNNTGTVYAPLPIVKTLMSCSFTNNPREICVTLNPHETERFSSRFKGQVQFEGETVDGVKFGSTPTLFIVYPNKNAPSEQPFTPESPADQYGDFVVLDGGEINGGGL